MFPEAFCSSPPHSIVTVGRVLSEGFLSHLSAADLPGLFRVVTSIVALGVQVSHEATEGYRGTQLQRAR